MKKFATVEVAGQTLELDAPGLKIRRPPGREPYVIWAAPPAAVAAGFLPKNVRLFPDWQNPADFERIALECRKWQSRALTHRAPAKEKIAPVEAGTLAALADLYRNDPESPLSLVQSSTRATYLRWLKLLSPYLGEHLSEIEAETLRSWYAALGQPAVEGAEPQARRASSGLQMLRLLFRFGAERSAEGCQRLLDLAMSPEFDVRPARRSAMTLAEARRFVDYALSVGEVRIALAQACQFELGLRQSEVIGHWEPIVSGQAVVPTDIVFQRQRWLGGLTFEMIQGETLALDAGQTIDLTNCPLVQRCLMAIDEPRGPLVVRQDGRPFDRFTFSRRWREIADGAGLPKRLRNLDS
ncbi:MAG: hypothetical protein P0Y66_22320 [Candidatus Kaistia colombiensis]|nr:MAG: hypothetical protein P0Y66_22320 [Kaistia sp.]